MLSLLITVGVANILHDDGIAGTYRRMRASNVTAPSYVGGVCAAGFMAALLMVVVHFVYLLLIGKGAHLSLGPTFVLCLLFGLFEVGFALVCGLLIKTRMGILWAIISISTPLTLLGGAFFPIDTAPAFMQQLAHISPMFWFMKAVEGLRDGDGEAWLVSAAILALFALLCYLVAGVRFATRSRSTG
jgi:ABC-2 type transport system permease protein